MHAPVPKLVSVTSTPELDEARAWGLIRGLAARARSGEAVVRPCGVRLDRDGALDEVGLGRGWIDVLPAGISPFRAKHALPASVERMLALYLPLVIGENAGDMVVGHVGQSLDGQIATSTGASRFITGQQDLVHTHRLRALFDVVLVGTSTVTSDNPRLTTRLVPGPHPTRVVVDPTLRSPVDCHVFTDDLAPTLILCAQGNAHTGVRGRAKVVEVESSDAFLAPAAILHQLRLRGLRRIFIEGGGVTISHFLHAGLLDRIHITISPVLLGQGRPGLSLPRIDGLDEAMRPRCTCYTLGEDVLFDCAFARTGG